MRHELLFGVILTAATFQTFAADPPHPGRSANKGQATAERAADSDAGTSASDDFLDDEGWRRLPEADRKSRMRRMILSRYEPLGKADPARISQYIQKFQQMNVYDPRVYLFHVTARLDPATTGNVVLSGEVNVAQFRSGLESTLSSLGFTVTANNIQVLPAKEPGLKIYGLSTTTAATLRKEPRERSEQVNSVSMGGWVRLLRHATADDLTTTVFGRHHSPSSGTAINEPPNQWYLAQSLEGYLGYVRKGDLKLYDDFTVPDGLVEVPTEAVAAGKKVAVPAGALVYKHGDSWELFEGGILPKSARVHSLEPHIAANDIKASMKPFMDTKYVWGGTTDHGIDCSGFTQFFLRLRGASVPRDAEEQATSGFIVAWGDDIAKKAKPGDIIFFTSESGRISHVAISLGGNDIIHSAGEGVHFSKLSDARHGNPDDTLLEGAIFARRIIVR